MNRFLIAAAAGAAGTTALHLIGGEADVHAPLLALTDGGEMALYVSVLWHGVSAMLLLCALTFGLAARDPQRHRLAVLLAAGLMLALGAVFLAYGVARLGSVWVAPQWVLLVPIGVLGALGMVRRDA
jgi:hypothetical protein